MSQPISPPDFVTTALTLDPKGRFVGDVLALSRAVGITITDPTNAGLVMISPTNQSAALLVLKDINNAIKAIIDQDGNLNLRSITALALAGGGSNLTDLQVGTFIVSPNGALPVIGDGATDQAANLQTILTTYRDVYIPYYAAAIVVNSTLRVPSNTRLRVHSATKILRGNIGAGGVNFTPILTNANIPAYNVDTTPTGTNDANITIEGGIWDGNEGVSRSIGRDSLNSGVGGVLSFVQCSNIAIRNLRVRKNVFLIQLGGVHGCLIEGVTSVNETSGDFFHIGGNVDSLTVRNCICNVPDDGIALNAWDWVGCTPRNGPITNVLIEACDVTASSLIRLSVGDGNTTGAANGDKGAYVRHVTVKDCIGTPARLILADYIADGVDGTHTTTPGISDDIKLRGNRVTGSLLFLNTTIKALSISDALVRGTGGIITLSPTTVGTNTAHGTIEELTLNGVHTTRNDVEAAPAGFNSSWLVYLGNGGTGCAINSLAMTDVSTYVGTSGGSLLLHIEPGNAVGQIRATTCHMDYLSGAPIWIEGTVTGAVFTGCTAVGQHTGDLGVFTLAATANVKFLNVVGFDGNSNANAGQGTILKYLSTNTADVTLSGLSADNFGWVCQATAGTLNLRLSDVRVTNLGAGSAIRVAGSAITVRSTQSDIGGATLISKSSGSIRWVGTDIAQDLTKLTPTAGDVANSDGSGSIAAGLSWYSGTAWAKWGHV